MSGLRSVVVALVVVLAAAGCGNAGPSNLPLGPVSDADMSLTANNQSDRALELYVNDIKIADVPAKSSPTIKSQDLPPFPWNAELRLTTGRTLVSVTITSGSVLRTESGSQGVGNRVDLSCGRIELYAVIPLGGPAPGPGKPGDCGP
ncbi:MAG TPA: hypothetical protein VJ850_05070 [Candidatus Limnocylindrales bacterium]|nr:hypothetical protein [Candidatus Limnocylindrales bacterium]